MGPWLCPVSCPRVQVSGDFRNDPQRTCGTGHPPGGWREVSSKRAGLMKRWGGEGSLQGAGPRPARRGVRGERLREAVSALWLPPQQQQRGEATPSDTFPFLRAPLQCSPGRAAHRRGCLHARQPANFQRLYTASPLWLQGVGLLALQALAGLDRRPWSGGSLGASWPLGYSSGSSGPRAGSPFHSWSPGAAGRTRGLFLALFPMSRLSPEMCRAMAGRSNARVGRALSDCLVRIHLSSTFCVPGLMVAGRVGWGVR